MRCPQCRSRELVEIAMSIGGSAVTFRSCSPCDVRWWQDEAGPLQLDQLLDVAHQAASA